MAVTRMADCHPDRKYYANGLCGSCYAKPYSAVSVRRDPEKKRAYMKQYTKTHQAAATRRYRLKHVYKTTQENVDLMLAEQDGRCAICHREPNEGRRLVIDHKHPDGPVRGMLCDSCNWILGYCRDDPQVLLAAATYLLR